MNATLDDIIRQHARPLNPIRTDERPVLRELRGVRAVMFDIYGTLLISASGDIGASQSANHGQAFIEALSAVGIQPEVDGETGVQRLEKEIQTANRRSRQKGIEFPEVDIVAIWGKVVSGLLEDRLASRIGPDQAGVTASFADSQLKQLALEYEIRVNPVWPMPHARECLEMLSASGLRLGIISNAQFFTIDVFRTLFLADANGFEFDDELQYYSYQYGQAKPGMALYQLALDGLANRGIGASEVLYIGNDMLKDVMPAASIGFRTALFAGDARSLRRRSADPRVNDVTPDLVITDLLELPKCIC